MTAAFIDASRYHEDPCERPSLSATLAKVFATKTPAHARLEHPRLGGSSRTPSADMVRGSVLHRLLLGAGQEIAVIEHTSYRSNDAKEQRELAIKDGKLYCLIEEYSELEYTASRLRERFKEHGIELGRRSELAVSWEEPVFMSDATVTCRAMWDNLHDSEPLLYDIKTTNDASQLKLERHIYDMGYDIQRAAHTAAYRAMFPQHAGREEMIFVFAETSPPYAVTPVELTGEYKEVGQKRWDVAVRDWHRCTTRNEWPGYVKGIARLNPPPWAMAQTFGEEP